MQIQAHRPRWIPLAVLLSVGTLPATASESAALPAPAGEGMRAGASVVDISPKQLPAIVSGGFFEDRADRVIDPLRVRSLVLDDGRVRVAIAIVDSLMLPRDLTDRVKEIVRASTGLGPERILIAATHTHSAPAAMGALGTPADEEYVRDLPERIARGIEEAARRLGPAELGWASARDPADTHCRRWILRPDRIRTDPFGSPTVRAMMHPGYQNPDFVGPAGPADDEVWVLAARAPGGRPLALLANYGMHYAGAPPVSADYFGVFSRRIAELLDELPGDPPFVGILSQGTAGDQHWMDYARPERSGIDRFTIGDGVARTAFEALRKIRFRPRAAIAAAAREIRLPVRVPDAKRLEWARGVVAGAEGRSPATLQEVYAREALLLAERPERALILQAIRIGELALVAIPAEVFGITGLKIKARSPLAATFVLELANGAEGYIPPPEQHRLGGYTTWPARTACLDENAEPAIVEAVLCLLEEVSGKRRRTEEPPPCAYGRAVLASGPLAWWRLEELEGIRAADAGGRGNHGSFEGNLAFSLEGPDLPGLRDGARPGRAVHLAGGDLRADLPIPGSAWTVELWFWNGLPADARSETGVLACLGPAGGAPPFVVLSIGGKERAQGKLLLSAPGAGPVGGATEIGLRTWHHVALRSDGARISVLLDGRAEPEISAAATAAGGDLTVRIGGRGPGDPGAFEGRIDEAAIYGRALGADEVSAHALAAISP